MKTIKGPAIFLAQFAGDAAPFNSLRRDRQLGRRPRLQGRADPDLGRPAVRPGEGGRQSKTYCDEVKGIAGAARPRRSPSCRPTCRASSSPCIRPMTPASTASPRPQVRGNPKARAGMGGRAGASWRPRPRRNLGLDAHATFSGALAWPYLYPWPQRPAGPDRDGVRRTGASAGGRSSTPSTTRASMSATRSIPARTCIDGVDLRDVPRARRRPPALQHPLRSRATSCCSSSTTSTSSTSTTSASRSFHVKDAEFNPTGAQGVYGGYPVLGRPRRPLPLARRRAGRFRRRSSPSSRSTTIDGWAVLEWECCLKHPEDGAREGAAFIADHIIRVTEKAFDDFAGAGTDQAANRRMLGIG